MKYSVNVITLEATPNIVHFNFQQSIIPAWWTHELVTWETLVSILSPEMMHGNRSSKSMQIC